MPSPDPLAAAQASLELVVPARAELGEGPCWDARRRCLWWVDILGGLVHRYDPSSGTDTTTAVGSPVGAVVPRRDGSLVVALAERIAALDPETGALETLLAFEDDEGPPADHGSTPAPRLRCNDAKADPAGRLWVGRMARDATPRAGALLRIDPDGTVTEQLAGLTIPNGLDWSPDGRTMIFLDSTWGEVRAYPFDLASGTLGEGRPLVRLGGGDALPDGLTIDAEGCLWVAIWGGGRLVRVAPDGTILGAVELPASQVTSCAFGGDVLADLYVTTARERFGPEDDEREPLAGGLFRCRPGIQGRAPSAFAG